MLANAVTKDVFLIPQIDDILDQLGGLLNSRCKNWLSVVWLHRGNGLAHWPVWIQSHIIWAYLNFSNALVKAWSCAEQATYDNDLLPSGHSNKCTFSPITSRRIIAGTLNDLPYFLRMNLFHQFQIYYVDCSCALTSHGQELCQWARNEDILVWSISCTLSWMPYLCSLWWDWLHTNQSWCPELALTPCRCCRLITMLFYSWITWLSRLRHWWIKSVKTSSNCWWIT